MFQKSPQGSHCPPWKLFQDCTNIWILSVAVTMGTYLIKWGVFIYITQFGIWEYFSEDTSARLTNNMIIQ